MASGRKLNPKPDDLMSWYDKHRRRLPWRALPNQSADPYMVWLSEIMLQQTTVAAVKPYFEKFLKCWPTVQHLAEVKLDNVLTEWAGLGYYARARNLHACAKVIATDYDGIFPDTEEALLALPGVGAYTAAAIAAIAFDKRAVVVDGNVERVMARIYAVQEPLPKAKKTLKALADGLTTNHRPGDYAQAVMDLGATVCTPKSPSCVLCPWKKPCIARSRGIAADLPRKTPKKQRPTRRGLCFWMTRSDGAILLRRRPEKGLLGGMMEIPSSPWQRDAGDIGAAKHHAPGAMLRTRWTPLVGMVSHTFTHFYLELELHMATIPDKRAETVGRDKDIVWAHLDDLDNYALPSVMRKVVKHALKSGR